MKNPPTGLYIHMPWCVKKCPYCDFNSHVTALLPEESYVEALIDDLKTDILTFGIRPLSSIFIGGGTPSLFSSHSMKHLLTTIKTLLPFERPMIEITLEANPGTIEQERFEGYLQADINRLSLGIQSFNPATLKRLGRIHDEQEAIKAVQSARSIGFQNINLDLMYAAPQQNATDAIHDLKLALSFQPAHLSWYQFTIEPNTYFHRYPPTLPHEESIAEMESIGYALLTQHGLERYEISAFSTSTTRCQHNLLYWTYGDYYGIGAGAHGKLSDPLENRIIRTQKHRIPSHYLDSQRPYLIDAKPCTPNDRFFEFILNTARLDFPIPLQLFVERTGLPFERFAVFLEQAVKKGFVTHTQTAWQLTERGRTFTNDVQLLALDLAEAS